MSSIVNSIVNTVKNIFNSKNKITSHSQPKAGVYKLFDNLEKIYEYLGDCDLEKMYYNNGTDWVALHEIEGNFGILGQSIWFSLEERTEEVVVLQTIYNTSYVVPADSVEGTEATSTSCTKLCLKIYPETVDIEDIDTHDSEDVRQKPDSSSITITLTKSEDNLRYSFSDSYNLSDIDVAAMLTSIYDKVVNYSQDTLEKSHQCSRRLKNIADIFNSINTIS